MLRGSTSKDRSFRALWVAVVFGCALVVAESSRVRADELAREKLFHDDLVPLLRTYCYDCHGASDGEGDVSLEAFPTAQSIMADRATWLRVLTQVKLGSMPPADGEQMAEDVRQRMIRVVDDLANAVDCVQNPNAGKVVMRRLNRIEYRNTIRDLLGVDYEPALNFPGDDVGYGFDNIGDVLSLPPLLMEKYLLAADAISEQAIITPPPADLYDLSVPGIKLNTEGKFNNSRGALGMHTSGVVGIEPEFPFGGEFQLTVTAFGDQAGDEACKMEIRLDGEVIKKFDVAATEPTDYTLSIRSRPGKRKVEIAFTNDFWNPDTKADRNFFLHSISLKGQDSVRKKVAASDLTESHRRVIFQTPDDRYDADAASRVVIERIASRAFRRPATDAEVTRLVNLASEVRQNGGTYEEGVQVALTAILISPHFLFKVEQYTPRANDGASRKLTQFELATRLSYFLWSSMPDEELFSIAWKNQLSEPQVLRQQIARMLRDSRSRAFIENFAGQWLQLRKLDSIEPDATEFPEYNESIRELLKRETLTFFAAVLRENLPVTNLLDGEFTYLNEDLAKYYGIEGVSGKEFRQVSLEGTGRGGILTQGSVLTVTSNPTRTSPVKRGKWILENLLNLPPPPPPPNVPELEKGELSGTLRQRMEQHRANPACAACHSVMDPLGFALENFDGIGRWRTSDGSDPIDASGSLPDGTLFNGVGELRSHLAEERGEEFVACVTEKLMTYALGRGLEYYDRCAVEEIMVQAKQYDYRFVYLIAAIVESKPFQFQGDRE